MCLLCICMTPNTFSFQSPFLKLFFIFSLAFNLYYILTVYVLNSSSLICYLSSSFSSLHRFTSACWFCLSAVYNKKIWNLLPSFWNDIQFFSPQKSITSSCNIFTQETSHLTFWEHSLWQKWLFMVTFFCFKSKVELQTRSLVAL